MTSKRYATGAVASTVHHSFRVAVPERDHPSRTRSDALTFARSVFGPDAALLDRLNAFTSHDVHGTAVAVRWYNVVVCLPSDADGYRRALAALSAP